MKYHIPIFCAVNLVGVNQKKHKSLSYLNLSSTIRPVVHCEEVLVPVFTELSEEATYVIAVEPNVNDFAGTHNDTDKDYGDYEGSSNQPICFSRGQLFDLNRDLKFSKEPLELLASRVNDKNLHPGTKITFCCMHFAKFVPFFKKHDELMFCKDIEDVLTQLGIENYVPEDWSVLLIAVKEV